MSECALLSLAPYACAVIPLEPMRKKANNQYNILNIALPNAIAAKYTAPPMCPTIATSTNPRSGVVMLVIMQGMDSASIAL